MVGRPRRGGGDRAGLRGPGRADRHLRALAGRRDRPGDDRAGPGERPTGAVLGRNDYGAEGYGGPKPPIGDDPHRYFFRLYGLSEPSGLGTGFTAEDLRNAMQDKIVAAGTLVGTFAR